MKKFLLDYISALLNDECNSLKICIRDLDQRSNSIDMYQENSLPPTTRNVEGVKKTFLLVYPNKLLRG